MAKDLCEMELASTRAADIPVAWLERFELREPRDEKQISLSDTVLLELCQRVDRARRREDWPIALEYGQLALNLVAARQVHGDDAAVQELATYGEAVVRLYAGALGLDRGDMHAATGQFQLSAKMFGDLEHLRAESIARAATSMAHAACQKWIDALTAYQQSVGCIDEMTPLGSSLKELRRQIVQTVSMMLDSYEQEQALLASSSTGRTPTQSCTGENDHA